MISTYDTSYSPGQQQGYQGLNGLLTQKSLRQDRQKPMNDRGTENAPRPNSWKALLIAQPWLATHSSPIIGPQKSPVEKEDSSLYSENTRVFEMMKEMGGDAGPKQGQEERKDVSDSLDPVAALMSYAQPKDKKKDPAL